MQVWGDGGLAGGIRGMKQEAQGENCCKVREGEEATGLAD